MKTRIAIGWNLPHLSPVQPAASRFACGLAGNQKGVIWTAQAEK